MNRQWITSGSIYEEQIGYSRAVVVGDWVLVHVGFAIARIDEAEAEASLALLGDALDAEAAADGELDADAAGGSR